METGISSGLMGPLARKQTLPFYTISYDFSEPQFGKDVRDRIISPKKSAIRRYCNEGNDIMSATDVYEALRARHVKGTSAVVCKLDQGEVQELQVNRITNFSAFHNFLYEEDGLCVVKAYGVGGGRHIPMSELFIHNQNPAVLKEVDI